MAFASFGPRGGSVAKRSSSRQSIIIVLALGVVAGFILGATLMGTADSVSAADVVDMDSEGSVI